MKKPINVLESGGYTEPNTFERDAEAVLFYSYLELTEYIAFLEEDRREYGKRCAEQTLKNAAETEKQVSGITIFFSTLEREAILSTPITLL